MRVPLKPEVSSTASALRRCKSCSLDLLKFCSPERLGLFWPKIFRRFVFGLIIAQATITGQFILKDARHEVRGNEGGFGGWISVCFLLFPRQIYLYLVFVFPREMWHDRRIVIFLDVVRLLAPHPRTTPHIHFAPVFAHSQAYSTIALMFLTYFFLRSTRARYDATSNFLPLEVATVMDISLDHDEELRRQRRHERKEKQQQQSPEISGLQSSLSVDDESLGGRIGDIDPFELAYVQPVIRASPHARPEQPFPPAQLGREAVILGALGAGSTVGVIGEDEVYDDTATVRVQHHNQNERRRLNQWWNDQIEQQDNQRLFYILIGEECGTMTCQVHKPGPAVSGSFV